MISNSILGVGSLFHKLLPRLWIIRRRPWSKLVIIVWILWDRRWRFLRNLLTFTYQLLNFTRFFLAQLTHMSNSFFHSLLIIRNIRISLNILFVSFYSWLLDFRLIENFCYQDRLLSQSFTWTVIRIGPSDALDNFTLLLKLFKILSLLQIKWFLHLWIIMIFFIFRYFLLVIVGIFQKLIDNTLSPRSLVFWLISIDSLCFLRFGICLCVFSGSVVILVKAALVLISEFGGFLNLSELLV